MKHDTCTCTWTCTVQHTSATLVSAHSSSITMQHNHAHRSTSVIYIMLYSYIILYKIHSNNAYVYSSYVCIIIHTVSPAHTQLVHPLVTILIVCTFAHSAGMHTRICIYLEHTDAELASHAYILYISGFRER